MDLFRCSMSPVAGDAVKAVLTPDEDGRVYCGQGPVVEQFERAFYKATGLLGAYPPLGVNSCTTAIDLALHLIGVKPGDEVACTPMTCSASNGPVVTRGAKIVWIDVDPITGLMSPESLARMVTRNVKAVIAVDWAGRHCDYAALKKAVGWDIPIIEDAAHCLYVPQFPESADYICWSFGPIKHLSCGGYGGALMPPEDQYRRAELLRWHGLDRHSKADFRCEQDIEEVGYRYHLTDDQAAVGLANLELAQYSVTKARLNAAWYRLRLTHVPGIRMPDYDETCNYWLHGLIVHEDRDGFAARMAEQGIPTSRTHARNDHHSAYAAATARQDGDLPGVTFFDSHQINIPGGHWITQPQLEEVARAVEASVAARV